MFVIGSPFWFHCVAYVSRKHMPMKWQVYPYSCGVHLIFTAVGMLADGWIPKEACISMRIPDDLNPQLFCHSCDALAPTEFPWKEMFIQVFITTSHSQIKFTIAAASPLPFSIPYLYDGIFLTICHNHNPDWFGELKMVINKPVTQNKSKTHEYYEYYPWWNSYYLCDSW